MVDVTGVADAGGEMSLELASVYGTDQEGAKQGRYGRYSEDEAIELGGAERKSGPEWEGKMISEIYPSVCVCVWLASVSMEGVILEAYADRLGPIRFDMKRCYLG